MTTPALLDEQLHPTYDASEGLRRGRQLAEHGMALVEAASSDVEKQEVDRVIAQMAASRAPFSLNDVRARLPQAHPRLRGARVMAAAKAGVIERTGVDVPSTLPSTRGHRIPVWVGT